MIDKKRVTELLADMESDRVEHTISFREDKLGPSICALANDLPNHRKPGYMLMGVNDDGKIAGMNISDEDLTKIGDIRSNGNLLPQPHLEVSEVFHFPEGEVVVLTVHPSDEPPVRFRGRVHIRIGPRKGIASPQEERVLSEKRVSTARTFDAQPCRGSTLDDISLALFKLSYLPHAIDEETLQANKRSPKEQLASLGFYDLGRDCCSNAGILLFGINPRFFIRGAYIQYIKFDGKELTTDVVAEKQLSGALATMLRSLNDLAQVGLVQSRPVQQSGFREKMVSSYPQWALRELLMNAVMHRDYESNAPIYINEFTDRIEIENPGGLYGDARPENFPHASDYRNPILAAALKNLGYVNQFNFGVVRAQDNLKQNGNPPAEFNIDLMTKFSVVVRIQKDWYA